MNIKTYTIGGKQFQLRPLTLKQRFLTKDFTRKIREQMVEAVTALPYAEPAGSPKWIESLRKALQVTVQTEDLILDQREEFNRFLATILIPAESERWTTEMIEQHKDLMWEIDEVTEGQVIADFFSRAMNSSIALPVSIEASMNEQRQSATSGTPNNSATPTTS
jgi:hypothetical protein